MNILIVRLGALGDIIHAIPAAAALRKRHPAARIDWLVDAKHREILDLVPVIDGVIPLEGPSLRGWVGATRRLRIGRYDVALDFQGLMKSAVLARASGAKRVLGFSLWHLREKGARPFYSESIETPSEGEHPLARHVIFKNLQLIAALGVDDPAIEFPLAATRSAARDLVLEQAGGAPVALINPGAAWPNKRWPPQRFGEIASLLAEVRGARTFVLWGPGEAALAQEVVDASSGAALLAPPTRLADLVEISRVASLMVSGDTGPLHVAAAVGTPVVSIFGPTDPVRNGPWNPADLHVSRYGTCGCHYQRTCHQRAWCLDSVQVSEMAAAVQERIRQGHGSC